jgi:hypothetical protein
VKTVKLLTWHDDITQKAAMLKRRGLQIDSSPLVSTSGAIGELARLNPAVLVLDLDRLPSNSRVIATVLRTSKSARHIPILFAGGLPEKINRIRADMPDATFASWSETPQALAALLQNPPSPPSVARVHHVFTTPLAQKLGIRADMVVSLIAAPDAFEECLGDLPENTSLTTRLTPMTSLALCFVRSLNDLAATLDLLTVRLPQKASVWIVHPKRTGKYHVDFNQNHVRDHALAAGLVDYKVCSIDNDWSALKFAWRER